MRGTDLTLTFKMLSFGEMGRQKVQKFKVLGFTSEPDPRGCEFFEKHHLRDQSTEASS